MKLRLFQPELRCEGLEDFLVVEGRERQARQCAAHHEGSHVGDAVMCVLDRDALGDLIVVRGEAERRDDLVVSKAAEDVASPGLGDGRDRDGQAGDVERALGRDRPDIVAGVGAEAFERQARDVRRLEIKTENLDEAEPRCERAHVDRRISGLRRNQRRQGLVAAERDAAEGEAIEFECALTLHDALDPLNAELAEAIDREVVHMEIADHQMVDAHCLDRGIEDGKAAKREGRKHRRVQARFASRSARASGMLG